MQVEERIELKLVFKYIEYGLMQANWNQLIIDKS